MGKILQCGYMSQGSLTCSDGSVGFDLTGPADFLLAQSHTELSTYRFTDFRLFEHT